MCSPFPVSKQNSDFAVKTTERYISTLNESYAAVLDLTTNQVRAIYAIIDDVGNLFIPYLYGGLWAVVSIDPQKGEFITLSNHRVVVYYI